MSSVASSFLENNTFGIHPPGFRLPATARVGGVRLAVSNLAQSVRFYSKVLGLAVLNRAGDLAKLGAHDSRGLRRPAAFGVGCGERGTTNGRRSRSF